MPTARGCTDRDVGLLTAPLHLKAREASSATVQTVKAWPNERRYGRGIEPSLRLSGRPIKRFPAREAGHYRILFVALSVPRGYQKTRDRDSFIQEIPER